MPKFQPLSFLVGSLASVLLLTAGCSRKEINITPVADRSIEVVISDIPFKTDSFLRIPYTLRTWEWKKSGLSLRQIDVLDSASKIILASYNTGRFPRIYMDPLPHITGFSFDKLDSYYFSIQLPIPLPVTPPERIMNRLVFRDTVNNLDLTIDGGSFVPGYAGSPRIIVSPLRGDKWLCFNQSTNAYHFHAIFFMNGGIGTGERFAFDAMQLDEDHMSNHDGDPGINSSYFCYCDTLYAVAGGVVVACSDTMAENDGNLQNHFDFKAPIDNAGNYMIIDIGSGHYAMYAHCIPHSIMVKKGDIVQESQPLALLGNSGNSTAPHLHFEIGDKPDFFMCNGIPFVYKKFTVTGKYGNVTPFKPIIYQNRMNEQYDVLSFD